MPHALSSVTSAGRDGWPEIEPGLLEEGGPLVPPFPVDVLPAPWNGWVADTAHGVGAPADYVAQALLAAVAGLCGAGVRAAVTPAWSEPLVLWQALVGGPSSGRTSALETIRLPLATVEKLLQRDAPAGREVRVVTGGARCSDLAEAMKAHEQGVLMWRDDPSAWLAGLGRAANTSNDERARFLAAWSAARPAGAERRLAVSIVGSLHAGRLGQALQEADDGLAARFLFAWPRPAPCRSVADAEAPREDEAVTSLHRLTSAVGSPEQPLMLAFDAEAAKAFDRFLRELHGEVRRAQGLMAGWLGRGRGTVPRLAAAFTLLAWSSGPGARLPRTIGVGSLRAAIRLWHDYFWPHARAVFDHGEPPGSQDLQVERVIRWLQAHRPSQVSREEIRRRALCQTVNAAAQQVIWRLESEGVLRGLSEEPLWRNGRPPRRWQVNPALHALASGGEEGVAESAESAETFADADSTDVSAN